MPSDAYFAGIIDGEGWIGIAKQGRIGSRYRPGSTYFRATVQVNMVTPGIPKALQERFGGAFREKAPRKHCHKKQYTWAVVCDDAEQCLKALLPYLTLKVEQAKLALKLRDFQREREVKVRELRDALLKEEESLVKQISALNS